MQIDAFLWSLRLMVEGMTGIFGVMLLLWGVIAGLNAVTSHKNQEPSEEK